MGVIVYRRYQQGETEIRKWRFKYNKVIDCYVCPETGVILPYTGRVDRNGYKYYSDKQNCVGCPHIEECCKNQGFRVIRRLICEELNENARARRLSDEGKELYKLRKEKVERSFADSKNNHGYRYAMYKGIEKNQNYTWLICATQNMKNIVTKLTKKPRKDDNNTEILFLFSNYESKNKKNKLHAFSHEVCRQSEKGFGVIQALVFFYCRSCNILKHMRIDFH